MNTQVRFRMRLYRDDTIVIGPGKVALLEAIRETGSISAAARAMGMSYRRAWLLLDEMNRALATPAVLTATGGSRGGGASLTPVGESIIHHYQQVQSKAEQAAADDITALKALIAADQNRSASG
ncbi:MAG: winged helix-turn-helix domain-containing protein [Burkholderiaceae bacterium]